MAGREEPGGAAATGVGTTQEPSDEVVPTEASVATTAGEGASEAETATPALPPPVILNAAETGLSVTREEEKILNTIMGAVRHFELRTVVRVAGGWVRDKVRPPRRACPLRVVSAARRAVAAASRPS